MQGIIIAIVFTLIAVLALMVSAKTREEYEELKKLTEDKKNVKRKK